jgi:ribosomal-protein-alanine N-acetyltransferase
LIYLRKPIATDLETVKSLYVQSQELHLPWTYPPQDHLAYLADEGRYFVCLEQTGEILGTFNISGIVRGFFQSAYLGYEVFSPHNGKGYMSLGLQLVITEAFEVLNLHRIEANIQPENLASISLVERVGFVKEGFSARYLNVGGKGWKDHQRWALINDSWSL